MFKNLPARFWRLITARSSYSPRDQVVFDPKSIGGLVDGIIAIAATLLAIELHVPEHQPGELGKALLEETDQYLIYALGFVMIMAAWINIHRFLRWVRGVDHYTTLLLLIVAGTWTLVPFTTRVLGDAVGDSDDMGSAIRLLSGAIFFVQVVWASLVVYLVRYDLFKPDLPPAVHEVWVPASLLLWIVPGVAFALSYLSPTASLAAIVIYLMLCMAPFEHSFAAQPKRTSASS